MDELIRVRILSRDYPLRVDAENVAATRQLARNLHVRMQEFKESHPDQSDLVAAVLTALWLAEELVALRSERQDMIRQFISALDQLDTELAGALAEP